MGKIAKNTVFLAIRTILVVLVTLFSSRLVLQNLGVEDFGIYNVVGSVIIFWNSVSGLFAQATQRFLSVSKATDTPEEIEKVFSTSLFLHSILSVLFFALVTIIGFIFINFFLVMDPSRKEAANWVFFFSILSSAITIITTPFLSAILANERMDVFALSTILDAIGKLGIAFLIPLSFFDGLIFYGCGVLFITLVIRLSIMFFSLIKFREVTLKWQKDKQRLKELTTFAGWNFLGNTAFHVSNEGLNFLLNIFFGPVVNAARGIATQISSALNNFSGIIIVASNPQICALAAKKDLDNYNKMISFSARSIFFFALIVVLPIWMSLDEILNIWLGKTPMYTKEFAQAMLVYSLINSMHPPLNSTFVAFGKMKGYQIIESTIILSSLLISFLLLTFFKTPPISVFIVMTSTCAAKIIADMFWARRCSLFSFKFFFLNILRPIIYVLLLSIALSIIVHTLSLNWYLRSATGLFIVIFVSFFLGFTSSERKSILMKISSHSGILKKII